jgi:hypothetical protein
MVKMSLVFYEVIEESQLDRQLGEKGEVMLWQSPPMVDDEVLMASDRPWHVVKVEAYRLGNDAVYVAMVNRVGVPVPAPEQWQSFQCKSAFPDASFCVYISPSKSILSCEWSMNGEPGRGQLEDYVSTGQGTLMKAEPTPWAVDRVQAYLPADDHATYSAIQLCWCREVALEMAA